MSKRKRRPDKGSIGSRVVEKRARAAAVAERDARHVREAEWPGMQAAAVAETMTALAALPAVRWRAPYTPAVADWGAQWQPPEEETSTAMPAGLAVAGPAKMPVRQPDGYYDGGTYGMTGAGESVLNTLAADAATFRDLHGRPITSADVPADVETLPARVLEAATLIVDWLDPAFCAAYVATGYLVTEDTRGLFTTAEIETWVGHVHDFRATRNATVYNHDIPPDLNRADEWVPTVLHPVLAEEFAARMETALDDL